MGTIKIITSELRTPKYHENKVNAYLDELNTNGVTNASIQHFVNHGYGETRKCGEVATIVTIITVEGK